MNGVDSGKAESEADNGSRRDDGVEPHCIGSFGFERCRPSECFRYPIGRRSRQHRYRQHAGADDAECKQQKSEITRQRSQRFGRLGCRIDVGDTVGIEDGGGGQDNGKGNHVGEDHANGGIDSDAVKLGAAASGQFTQRAVYLALIHFLDFLRGLPEKQIGAYRGAENGHHHQEIVGIDGGRGPDRRKQCGAPRDVHRQRGCYICEQRERHEFQHRRISAIRNEDLQQGRCRCENQGVLVIEPANHQ